MSDIFDELQWRGLVAQTTDEELFVTLDAEMNSIAAALSPAEMKKVQAFVEAKTFEPLIEKDKQLGQLVPVNQTPYTVLHTKSGQTFPVVGFVSYDVLKTFLDQLVSQK